MMSMLKSIKKRKLQTALSLILAAVLAVTFLFGTVSEAANTDFGINLSIKATEKFYTFDVEVKRKASSFEGRVVVVVNDDAVGYVGYSKEISVAAEATEYASINVPKDAVKNNARFYIYILDEDDNIEYQEIFTSIADILGTDEYSKTSIPNLDLYDVTNVQGYMEEPAGELSGVLSILIIIYIVLVGPVIYLILKAVNKREFIWIVVPGMTVVFLFIMYLIGMSTTAKGDRFKSIELVNYTTGTSSTYVFGYTPSPQNWTVKTKDNYSGGRSLVGGYNSDETTVYRSELQEDLNNTILRFKPRYNYETACFELRSDAKPEGSITMQPSATDPFLIKVTNKTGQHLDYLYMSSMYGDDLVEDVDPNETVEIRLAVTDPDYSLVLNKKALQDIYIKPAYDGGDVKKSSELAAIYIALEAAYVDSDEAFVIGVTKGTSKTDRDEKSFRCFYDSYRYQNREEY